MIVFTDTHISEDSFEELEVIFQEILSFCSKDQELVCIGDYYDKRTPNVKEVKFGTKWAKLFRDNCKEFHMIKGNHAEISTVLSNVDYLENLDIRTYDELALKYFNRTTYFGHFMTNKSICSYGEYSRDKKVEELKYDICLIGHQHDFQELDNCVYHLGSCRYVTFGENENIKKKICRITEDGLDFIDLKTPYPLVNVDIKSLSKTKNLDYNSKVRLTVTSFDEYKEIVGLLPELEKQFYTFKLASKIEETNQPIQEVVVDALSNKDLVTKWIDNIEDEEVKGLLSNEMQILC